jgi:hypothetical protein
MLPDGHWWAPETGCFAGSCPMDTVHDNGMTLVIVL